VIRAFIAVAIDPGVVETIAAAMSGLRPHVAGVRWVAPGNFHLTLKFLGGIDEAVIEPIGSSLRAQLRLFRRFTINVKGLGVFPSPRRPRVLWVGLTGDGLVPLALGVESALQPLGFTPESRKFTPHLTIGRWREALPTPASLKRELEKWQAHEFGKFTVESVKLMQSVLKPGGANYHDLITIPLSR
jgi:RNA 2',3'-cyclic 3'-phosphodiesterase